MPHIQTGNSLPGILGLMFYKPVTGRALSNYAQTLLRGSSPLTSAERELIAAHVSRLNECSYCYDSHRAAADALLDDGGQTTAGMALAGAEPPVNDRMKALLQIAGKVQRSGKAVTANDIEYAKAHGATDEMIHDTVLVAASFCMFNRYVDGLGTLTAAAEEYPEMGRRLAKKYAFPPLFLAKWVLRSIEKKRRKAKPV